MWYDMYDAACHTMWQVTWRDIDHTICLDTFLVCMRVYYESSLVYILRHCWWNMDGRSWFHCYPSCSRAFRSSWARAKMALAFRLQKLIWNWYIGIYWQWNGSESTLVPVSSTRGASKKGFAFQSCGVGTHQQSDCDRKDKSCTGQKMLRLGHPVSYFRILINWTAEAFGIKRHGIACRGPWKQTMAFPGTYEHRLHHSPGWAAGDIFGWTSCVYRL